MSRFEKLVIRLLWAIYLATWVKYGDLLPKGESFEALKKDVEEVLS